MGPQERKHCTQPAGWSALRQFKISNFKFRNSSDSILGIESFGRPPDGLAKRMAHRGRAVATRHHTRTYAPPTRTHSGLKQAAPSLPRNPPIFEQAKPGEQNTVGKNRKPDRHNYAEEGSKLVLALRTFSVLYSCFWMKIEVAKRARFVYLVWVGRWKGSYINTLCARR